MDTNWDAKVLGGSIKRGIVNPDLQQERDNCSFDKKELQNFIFGQELIKNLEEKQAFFQSNPKYRLPTNNYEMTKNEVLEEWWKVYFNLMQYKEGQYFKDIRSEPKDILHNFGLQPQASPLDLHLSMFAQTIENLGSDEQQKKYLPAATLLNIIGCYAQTELGHGSNVAGLETTATLDQKTNEFVIHTPNIKATKFWPGALGVQATHAVVMARLIVAGKDHGIQPFIVQIRSLEDHKPMPGIKVGDLGVKFGYNYVDNGWLSFDHVRISRDDILSRFIKVA